MSRWYSHADQQQEYATLLLEGVEPSTARKKSWAAAKNGDRIGTHFAHTTAEFHPHDTSHTLDTRTDQEREQSWAHKEAADNLLAMCTPHQRTIANLVWGLETGEPLSQQAAAKVLGIAPQSVNKAVALIKHKASVAAGPTEWKAHVTNTNRANALKASQSRQVAT